MSSDEQEFEDSSLDELKTEADVTADALPSAKEEERRRIQAEIEEFLNRGGTITEVDSSVMSDPPKRPESNYGGQPI